MLSSFLTRIYHWALYAYLYIQSCLLMATSYTEERLADSTERRN